MSKIDTKRSDHILNFLEKWSVLRKPQLTFLISAALAAPGMMNINVKNNIPVIIWQKLQLGILVDVNETAKTIRTVIFLY